MPSAGTVPVRQTVLSILALGALLVPASSVSAQVGVGARMAWVTSDSDLDVDSVRFCGRRRPPLPLFERQAPRRAATFQPPGRAWRTLP